MDKTAIIIALMLSHCVRGEINTEENSITITNSSQPGLFFEPVYDLRFVTNHWQITCYLDTAWEKYQLAQLEEQIDQLKMEYGKSHEEKTPHFESIEQKFNETYGNFRRIDEEMRHLNGTLSPETLLYYRPKANYSTKDEGVLLLEHSNQLFLESSISERTPEDRQIWEDLYQGINNTIELIKSANNSHMYLFHNTVRAIEDQLDRYIVRGRVLLQTIETLKGSKLCTAILNHGDLLYVKHRIEAVGVGLLPFSTEMITMEKMLQLATIEFGVVKRRISVNIVIPLVRYQRTSVYEIHALPAPQSNDQILYIKPENELMLVNNYGHYFLSRSELYRCNKVDGTIVCDSEWFMYREDPSCEFNLLVKPNQENYENCKVMYKKDNPNIFTRAVLGNQWLFVTFNKINITTQCNGIKEERTIESTGLIKIKGECTLRYHNVNLTTEKHTEIIRNEIIIPKKNLQLERLTPLFNDEENIQKLIDLLNQGKHEKDFWEIVRLAQHAIQQNDGYNNVTVGIVVLTGILVVLMLVVGSILGVLYYFGIILRNTPDVVELNIETANERPTNSTNNRAILRFL